MIISLPTYLNFAPKGGYAIAIITSAILLFVSFISFLISSFRNRPRFTLASFVSNALSGCFRVMIHLIY